MQLRRHAVAFVLLFAQMLTSGAMAHAAPPLRILAWPGYADDDLVAAFEARHDIKVEVSFVTSDEVLRKKISRNNASDYDVFAANTAEMHQFIQQGLVQPLRLDNIPNQRRQLKRFRDLERIAGTSQDGQVYALPFTYAEMGLIYDRQQFDSPPTSLASLWDPRYQGRVLAFNTSSHNFSIASLALGGAPFRIAERDFEAVSRKLIALRRNVLTFYSEPEESAELFREHRIALLYANYGRQQLKQLADAGADVGYVIPREGALAWLDCWAVSRGARDRLMAERWIDYSLEPGVSRTFSQRQGLANTLEISPASASEAPLIWLQPVEDAARREALWTRILSGQRAHGLAAP